MRKRSICAILSILLVSTALVLTFAPASLAADWTCLASSGISNANNINLIPGAVFKGNLAVGSVPILPLATPGAASMYMYNGVNFTRVGTTGFGNADCGGLIPTAVYRGELWIGMYDNVNGGELYHWNGEGKPALVPETANGWGRGADYTSVIPFGSINDELVVCVESETEVQGGACLLYKYNGTTWKQIVGGSSGVAAGWGVPNNMMSINLLGERSLYDGKMVMMVVNQV